jgi:hypothetical protein
VRLGRVEAGPADPADVIWGTDSSEFFLPRVRDRGWEPSRFHAWLAETWKRLLLR